MTKKDTPVFLKIILFILTIYFSLATFQVEAIKLYKLWNILASVSFWQVLIIELVARTVSAHLIIQ